MPFLYQTYQVMKHPLAEFATFRSGMAFSHLPESWVYAGLFFLMALGALLSAMMDKSWKKHRYALALIGAVFIAMHQQAVHGVILDFVSHYTLSMALAAICAVLLMITIRSPWTMIAGLAGCIYLAGLTYDNRYALQLFQPVESRFAEQHFADLLPVLDEMPRVQILSDPATSQFLAASTKHDVAYSIYLQNVLMPHEEIAERYCLTQLPVAPEDRHIEEQQHLIYPAANRAFENDPSVRAKEVKLVKDACAAIDKDPVSALAKYGIDYVLWDQQRQPTWHMGRLGVALTKTGAGSGWTLFRVP